MKKTTEKKPAAAGRPSENLAKEICAILSSKKAEDIVMIDVEEKTTLCDYFVIASGHSDNLEEKMSEKGVEPRRTEGTKEGRWGVLDYGDVIVHVFNDESRLFYHLERLWEEGSNITPYKD